MADVQKLRDDLVTLLAGFRLQGRRVPDVNPIAALADELIDRLQDDELSLDDLEQLLHHLGDDVWRRHAAYLRFQVAGGGGSVSGRRPSFNHSFETLNTQTLDWDKKLYAAVFTAHPVFALRKEASLQLCQDAEAPIAQSPKLRDQTFPSKRSDSTARNNKTSTDAPSLEGLDFVTDRYTPRDGITLQEEHQEVTLAINNARDAIDVINRELLRRRRVEMPHAWKKSLPKMLSVSTWVGYDLDGRLDIRWYDRVILRLREKAWSLERYVARLRVLVATHEPSKSTLTNAPKHTLSTESKQSTGSTGSTDLLHQVINDLAHELEATLGDVARFEGMARGEVSLSTAAEGLTRRDGKLTSSEALAQRLHTIAMNESNVDIATELMVVAADIAAHGFGLGEIHLRVNAVQIHNAMLFFQLPGLGSMDVFSSMDATRTYMDRLASRIQSETPSKVSFQDIEEERTTSGVQLMLARKFLEHIDADQPIRLLIAECEHPITLLAALYMAHRFGVEHRLDISPLFETTAGLQTAEKIMSQVLGHSVFKDYVRRRGRLAIQTGFSDAGRFIGQIAANLAIERMQLKLSRLVVRELGEGIDLLLFNTHGESLGRGGAHGSIEDRQHFILSPYVRSSCASMGLRVVHQSSFQGGDGYRLFGTPSLAVMTMKELFWNEVVERPSLSSGFSPNGVSPNGGSPNGVSPNGGSPSHAPTNGVPLARGEKFGDRGEGERSTMIDRRLSEDGVRQTETDQSQEDIFYQSQDFALDMFLILKQWHEELFKDPAYGDVLGMFGSNMLPKTGSRPTQRIMPAGNARHDPSKIRAITHNAILQQLGFLVNVIGGIGSAARLDPAVFAQIYARSQRLQKLVGHAARAKSLGSLNTMLAYGRLLDKGFWIDRAYHSRSLKRMEVYRQIGASLGSDERYAVSVRRVVTRLREDLIDFYRLSKRLEIEGVRVEGTERSDLDLLHAIRIALIVDCWMLILQVPRFAESSNHSNDDLIRLAFRLDFSGAMRVIRQEFSLEEQTSSSSSSSQVTNPKSSDAPNRQTSPSFPSSPSSPYHELARHPDAITNYGMIAQSIVKPIERRARLLLLIAQMISGYYHAHG